MSDNKMVRRIVSHPSLCFVLTVLIVAACSLLAAQVTKNTTPYFLDKTHSERIKESAMTKVFLRSKETIVLVLKSKQGEIFTRESITLLENIHHAVESLDLIELLPRDIKTSAAPDKPTLIKQYNKSLSAAKNDQETAEITNLIGQYLFPVRNVKSLLNTDDITMQDDEIIIAPNFNEDKISQWEQGLGKEVLDNPLLLNTLLSPNGRAMAVQMELNIDADNSENTAAIFNKIRQVLAPIIANSNYDALYSGSPVVNVEISNIMEKDNQRYFPMIVAVIALILFFLFRSAWAPFFALSVSIVSIIITFGVMGLLGISLNIVTTILPIFIITIGVTDAIHVLSESKQDQAQKSNRDTIIYKVSKLFRAMLLTSLTTALGFFSLSFTEITNIREFGLMVGVSAIIAFIVSVTILPALMSKLNFTSTTSSRPIKLFELVEQTAQRQTTLRCFTLLILLLAFSVLGLPKFYVDQQNLNSFEPSTQLRLDDQEINDLLGGTVPVSIWISSDEANGILQNDVLSVIEKLEARALEHKIIGYSASIAGYIKRLNEVLSPENKMQSASDLDQDLISQYLFLLEGGPSRDLESLSSVGPYDQTRVVLMSNTDGSKDLQALIDDLRPIAATLPEGTTFQFTGYGSMNAAAAKEIVYGQLSSIVISVLSLALILLFIYRSLKTALIAIFPLSMSLLVMFGVMGMMTIPLDIGSSLLCGIAFGIGIDYSIHIIEAYQRNLDAEACREIAVKRALSEVSFPILTSAFTISAGFSILLLSEFQPIFYLGLLISITMIISAFSTLFIVPTLLKLTKAGSLEPAKQALETTLAPQI